MNKHIGSNFDEFLAEDGTLISPFEKWRLETIPQVGFTPEIRELLAMAFEGGRQSVLKEKNHESIYK